MFRTDSRLIRFLTRVCDLLLLNLALILSCCTVILSGAAVTALYSVTLKMVRGEDDAPVKSFLRALRENFFPSSYAAILLLADVTLLAVLRGALYAGTLVMPPPVFVPLSILAVFLTALLSYLFPLLARYARRCIHQVSGQTVSVSLTALAENLEGKAHWLMEHIRRQEWIKDGEDGWFNSYYDNHCRPLEGIAENGVRMMLTGQVFAIMSGTARSEQVGAIVRSADRYLYRREAGGYRLNTDIHELKLDMGRMFGFAYGEKENGAVFSHMTVMYANALYRRGFVREGYRALQSLAETAMDFSTSKIFPGIPEYFNADGRGMYHYLIGAASWYMLTVITQAFGVRGEGGGLVIEPKLVREQFDGEGKAAITLPFAGKELRVVFVNPSGADFGQYRIERSALTAPEYSQPQDLPVDGEKVILRRETLSKLPEQGTQIIIELTQRR